MSEAKGQQEPSMEEILASIRRIIAEDDPAKPPIDVEMDTLPPSEEGILELTEIAADEPAEIVPEPEPEPYRPPPPRPRLPDPPAEDDRDHLVSARPAAASSAAFTEMTNRLRERRGGGEVFLGNGAITLEEIVRELLKPMLREWLDDNLPPLVERLVQEEIKRLAREAL
jgi:cell pole-organizing protein PopZ